MPSINDQAAADAGRCLDRLIANVNSELTSACMIPITIPKKEMVRLVTESKKWFYKNYEDSVHETYYIVPNQAFQTELFKNKREIPLPGPQADGSGNVISVNELSQAGEFLIGAGNNGFSMDADFTLDNFLMGKDKPLYLCTDRSRNQFKCVDLEGKLIEDPNATNIAANAA